jgi:tRNA threonylcarbamoyladenosine biosynthesis protein TsaB
MLILALDTSSAAGSAAIVRDGVLAIEREGDGTRTHGERLPLELMALLDEGGCSLADLDGFAVITGPGSFTGLRVGIATIQGLALARRKLVTPVSAFEALLFGEASNFRLTSNVRLKPNFRLKPDFRLKPEATYSGVWIDAQRKEVFAALYGADARTTIEAPTSLSPAATIEKWIGTMETGARVQFVGNGAVRYADIIRAALGDRAILPEVTRPLAGAAGLIAAANPARAVTPHAVVPLYVRRSDAELARDRAAAD